MIKTTLTNWAVVQFPANFYEAPELRVQCLTGKRPQDVTSLHSRVTTSPIIGKRWDEVVTRSGSHYTLLEVDPKYEAAYPGALKRLMDSLPELPKLSGE
jgi:hypothetical protein